MSVLLTFILISGHTFGRGGIWGVGPPINLGLQSTIVERLRRLAKKLETPILSSEPSTLYSVRFLAFFEVG